MMFGQDDVLAVLPPVSLPLALPATGIHTISRVVTAALISVEPRAFHCSPCRDVVRTSRMCKPARRFQYMLLAVLPGVAAAARVTCAAAG